MAAHIDAKAYYGYLFESDKKPTKVLVQLLRAIAHHIVAAIGNPDEKCLSPNKLASFYKAMGGNYDSLFVEVPPPSISWIYASIGCQHTLQPTLDDFQPPSVPALTTRGFVRWQSLEILLGPEEHVPFIQNAVRDFGLKNPETGEEFPLDLPKEAFPLTPDPEIEKWHAACAERLRLEARGDDPASRPHLPPRPRVQAGFKYVPPRRSAQSHSPGRSPRPRSTSAEYFEAFDNRPPIKFQHVSSQTIPVSRPVRPKLSKSPTHSKNQYLAPEVERFSRPRRRSVPEHRSSPSPSPGGPTYSPNPQPASVRPHSHPRPYRAPSVSSVTSDTSESEEEPQPSDPMRKTYPAPGQRLTQREIEARYTPNPSPPVPAPSQPVRHRRDGSRPETSSSDERRKSWAPTVPVDLSGKLSSQFLQNTKSPVKDSNERNGQTRRRVPRSQSRGTGNVRWKEMNEVREFWNKRPETDTEDEEDIDPLSRSTNHGSREERRSSGSDRERRRIPLRDDRDRDRDRSREDGPRRSTSHDALPQRQSSGRKRIPRDRDRYGSPVRGVDGRRYPAAVDGYR